MNGLTVLQISVALMTAIATLLLGLSQDNTALASGALFVPLASLIFIDWLGWFSLHRYLAAVLGISALLYAFVESRQGGVSTQFVSVAILLIHLQWILLLQRKTWRIYWQLLELSLLQVVVAAALNLFFVFGPLLVLYVALAITALLLMFILRSTSPFWDAKQEEAQTTSDVRSLQLQSAADTIEVESKLPAGFGGTSAVNPRSELLRHGFLSQFVKMAFVSLLVSVSVFFLVPRSGNAVWRPKSVSQQTGYSGEVDLDNSSAILESPAVVMRVSFEEESNGEPYAITQDPYFRGGVLDWYKPRVGRWTRVDDPAEDAEELRPAQRIYSVVRQRFNMERQRGGVVFSVAPPCAVDQTPKSMAHNPGTHEIIFDASSGEDAAEYSIGTTAFQGGLQSEFVPKIRPARSSDVDSEFVRRELPELTELADQLVEGLKVAEDDPSYRVRVARALNAHFANSGLYKYSLSPSPDRDRGRDPVEDFVTNHRTGHCQYFASALTLMLRSQGIPARIVVGYRGGVYNAVGNYYQIREMDAHAWVEVLLLDEQVPDDEIRPREGLYGDAWMRLDPTPGSSEFVNSVALSPWRAKLNDAIDYLQLLWSEYVVGLNEKRQKKAVYEPIRNVATYLSDTIFNPSRWAERWQQLIDRFQGDLFSRQMMQDMLIAVVGLTLVFYMLRFLVRSLWRLIKAKGYNRLRHNASMVGFYRRFENILLKVGIRRSFQQTPLEFAHYAQEQLESRGVPIRIPQGTIEAFYRVRYGDQKIKSDELQSLDQRLIEFQKELREFRRGS